MTLITSGDWVAFIALCGLMGVTGQLIRAIGGAKKINDQARTLDVRFADVFDGSTFLTSLATGFAAGVVAGLSLKPDAVTSQFLLGVLAAGYTGADFIEAFLKKSLPDIQDAAKVAEAKPALPASLMAATLQLGTSVSEGVRTVIANFKHVAIADVMRDKKLSDPSLSFDDTTAWRSSRKSISISSTCSACSLIACSRDQPTSNRSIPSRRSSPK